ncbi:NAD-dependent protein deacetylase of SIR2 family protein [Clostridiaceae bacterium JG1575]|nr:NAD-dependent protein deacetylase of SIR2 family protein [Clostridiaceae bacterium JG1575]
MNEDTLIEKAKKVLEEAKRVVVLSGAGLSTEAGIPDFRSKKGLYSVEYYGYPPETILSHRFFNDHPDLFFSYLRDHLNVQGIGPDDSYRLLATLEAEGRVHWTITQNIDSLHRLAGSQKVCEVHGTLRTFSCDRCGKKVDPQSVWTAKEPVRCACGGMLRPDVVLFDEEVCEMQTALSHAMEGDCLLVLGTSLVVYPVASIPQIFLRRQLPVVILNRDPTPYGCAPGVIELQREIGPTLKKLFPKEAAQMEATTQTS